VVAGWDEIYTGGECEECSIGSHNKVAPPSKGEIDSNRFM